MNSNATTQLQLRELSFNLEGQAFRHPEAHSTGPTYLNARPALSKLYKNALKKSKTSRQSISLTEEEEAQVTGDGYFLVGFMPRNVNITFVATPKKQGRPIGLYQLQLHTL